MSATALETLATSDWIPADPLHIQGIRECFRVQFFVCICETSKEKFLRARIEEKRSAEKTHHYLTNDENRIFFHTLKISEIPTDRVRLLQTIDPKKINVCVDFSQGPQSPKIVIKSKE